MKILAKRNAVNNKLKINQNEPTLKMHFMPNGCVENRFKMLEY